MASIVCRQSLWQLMRGTDLCGGTTNAAEIAGISLPNWAATAQRFDGLELVIATEAKTHICVVFPVQPIARFREAFAAAIDAVLEDFGVGLTSRLLECTVPEAVRITRLVDKDLSALLTTVAIYCDSELCDHSDLRVVQRNLNTAPIGGIAGSPADSIPRVFPIACRRTTLH